MNLKNIHNVYFLGAGGIGMSALARYFKSIGMNVAGYDKTPSEITKSLIKEGIEIHFKDDISFVPSKFKSKKNNNETLVVYTPAIPHDHSELNFFKKNCFLLHKRAEVLGFITRHKRTLAIAGTHGKTTVTTMTAHLLRNSGVDCSAFLGGISKNYKSNLLLSSNDNVVVEADEYDRSFLQLSPFISVITSMDADHLDIYSNKEEVIKSFNLFASQTVPGGKLILKKGLNVKPAKGKHHETFYYSLDKKADYYADNIRLRNGFFIYDIMTPFETITNVKLGLPGRINIENSIAATAVAMQMGVSAVQVKKALSTFKGVKRRFDYHIKNDKIIFIDDYAHHPEELRASISSIKELYPKRKLTGIFQPHLYSRTRDFASDFAESLSLLDELILLDIYPARELPIQGVTSEIIFKNVKLRNKILCSKDELPGILKSRKTDIVMTLGAGDIDRLVSPIKKLLKEKCGK